MKYNSLLNKIFVIAFRPITYNWVLFIAYAMLLYLPGIFEAKENTRMIYAGSHLCDLGALSFGISYILCFIGLIISKVHLLKYNKALFVGFHLICHLILLPISIIDSFIRSAYGLHYSVAVFRLINETDSQVHANFLHEISQLKVFYLVAFVYFAILLFEFLLLKWKHIQSFVVGCIKISVITYVLAYTLRFAPVIFQPTVRQDTRCWVEASPISRFGLWELKNSWTQSRMYIKQLDNCVANLNNIAIDSCDYTIPNIIVIIGESYIKSHSNLFGYQLNTCPVQVGVKGLLSFDDVTTPVAITSEAFKNFFSTAVVGEDWGSGVLFPAVFKEAGYNVIFYSNQFSKHAFDEGDGDYFVNHPEIESKCFSVRNNRLYQDDADFLNDYIAHQDSMMKDNNLVLLHLNGQHTPYNIRYPKSAEYFTSDSLSWRTDLSPSQKTEVAEYDNALRYNDSIVGQIINMYKDTDALILYFSDHGDEVHDVRPKVGRAYDLATAPVKSVQCQMNVPFWIYMTDSCRNRLPELSQTISKAVNNPFMIDCLPHILMYLSGIHTSWYRPDCNPLEESFIPRKRLFSVDGENYNIDYDEKCQ